MMALHKRNERKTQFKTSILLESMNLNSSGEQQPTSSHRNAKQKNGKNALFWVELIFFPSFIAAKCGRTRCTGYEIGSMDCLGVFHLHCIYERQAPYVNTTIDTMSTTSPQAHREFRYSFSFRMEEFLLSQFLWKPIFNIHTKSETYCSDCSGRLGWLILYQMCSR